MIAGTGDGPSLALADRERALAHAAELILASWRSFDRARPGQPEPDARDRTLLTAALPETGEDPVAALDDAATMLDRSLSPARPRYLAYVGSSGL